MHTQEESAENLLTAENSQEVINILVADGTDERSQAIPVESTGQESTHTPTEDTNYYIIIISASHWNRTKDKCEFCTGEK